MPKKRILIVDDDVSVMRVLHLYLEETGRFDVKVQNEGADAIAVARAFRPDLVLLDLVMPDADGAAIAGEISEDPVLKGTPIVFLTALVSHKEVGDAGQIGGHPFLAKPADPEIVIHYIDRYARS